MKWEPHLVVDSHVEVDGCKLSSQFRLRHFVSRRFLTAPETEGSPFTLADEALGDPSFQSRYAMPSLCWAFLLFVIWCNLHA